MNVLMDKLARFFALCGGSVLGSMILLICGSVLGRSINSLLHSDLLQTHAQGLADALLATGVGPINGDYEIVEAGMAFAIFAFLPICQLQAAHATVDIFTSRLPAGWNRLLRAVTEVAFAAVLILFAWQLLQGGLSKFRSGQTTLLLEFPVWWSYGASIVACAVAALVAVYVAIVRSGDLLTGRESFLREEGAEH